MFEKIRRPWLGSLLFTTPLVFTLSILFVVMELQGYLRELYFYPVWLLVFFSLPFSVPIGAIFFMAYALLVSGQSAQAGGLFVISIYVGAFFGTWINGYIFLTRRLK